MPVLTASSSFPADDIVAAALRDVVQDRCRVGQVETLTVNDARAVVESKLGLASGCIKEDKRWRELSKDIIRAEFVRATFPPSHLPCSSGRLINRC